MSLQSVTETTIGRDRDRDLDVVVYGATGYVGRLIAGHLARNAPAGVRIGLAGRSRERLEEVRRSLPASAGRWSLVVADSSDEDSLAVLAEHTHVVLSTVGPYARHGLPLVSACAYAGTDYVDLTGETLFVRDSIDRYDEVARRSGARIVHSCGFDSMPSDLGVLLTADHAREEGQGTLTETTLHVRRMRGGMSGGTLDSMRLQVDSVRGDRSLARKVVDPYALSPDRAAEPEPEGRVGQVVLERSADTGSWAAPFFMGGFNAQVVRRSNALVDWAYGRGLRYREVVDTGRGRLAPLKALGMASVLPALATGLATPGLRQVVDRVLPSPGEGPSEQARARGEFVMEVHATTTTGARYVTTVAASYDPGYDGTAIMIGEAALTLVLDRPRLPALTGVLTPATGLGEACAARLVSQGFTITTRRV
ncbi:saccharopine dehydrogenase family protein [Arsenicicoccus dermatophilus]|uniref:saccharopine dehydrogenase family protein n=1 Tax=Arsenicicoccus dermatophilus TaxID=1076331 RepID=UPI001F4C59C1|nr:saccharopine dehydrogenase NADP-binding domain-containing protein [Arsenicicoccus dermatophilus]MCH8614288.1 saccharopine dehydrogenase NADP-binding domain-containing protein [Arsenicicoccus dermatophilus]